MSLLINSGDNGVVSANLDTLKAFARSQLGFTLQDMKEAKLSEAILEPVKYMNDRKAKKIDAEKNVIDTYANTFNKLIQQGYPEDYAKQISLNSAKHTEAVEFGLLNDVYPDIVNNLARNQASNTVKTATNPYYGVGALNIKKKAQRKKKSHRKRK